MNKGNSRRGTAILLGRANSPRARSRCRTDRRCDAAGTHAASAGSRGGGRILDFTAERRSAEPWLVLGLGPSASEDVGLLAWNRICLQLHPDKLQGLHVSGADRATAAEALQAVYAAKKAFRAPSPETCLLKGHPPEGGAMCTMG